MKSIIRELFLDRDMIKAAKKVHVNKDQLYNQLSQGRITLQEYLRMI